MTISTNETKLSPNIPGSNAKQHGARGNTASETKENNTKQRKTKLIKENTKQREPKRRNENRETINPKKTNQHDTKQSKSNKA